MTPPGAPRTRPGTALLHGVLLAALALAPEAGAQEQVPTPRPERLYVNTSVLLGSARMVGLGGAYVGIAEGVEASASNLAALAHRGPRLERDWDVGATLSWLDVPLARSRREDLDNDGLPDDVPRTFQMLGGLQLQLLHGGAGFFLNTRRATYCASAACEEAQTLGVTLTSTAFGGALALGADEFLLGVGLYTAEAVFRQSAETWRYRGTGLGLDVLYRPQGRPYRVGLAVRPSVVGSWRPQPGQEPLRASEPLYEAVVTPGVLSLGVSWRMGEGAEHYNRLSPAARRQLVASGKQEALVPEPAPDAPLGRWLVTAQLDVLGSVERAVPVRAFAEPGAAERVGEYTLVQPRAGVEHETLPGRLRTRLGLFVEPSPFSRTGERPHLTGGFELFLLRYLEDWALTASFDVARRYSNLGVSVGFWR